MNLLLLVISASLVGQAPAPKNSPTSNRPASSYTEEEIYKAAKSALAEAKGRAMAKDLSLRSKALQVNRDIALKALCQQFHLTLEELLAIIERGEEKDGTAARKRLTHDPAKLRQKQENAMVLGMMGAQLQAQASVLAQQSQAQQYADQARLNNLLRSSLRGESLSNYGTGADSGGYYRGPRQPPGYYAGGVGSSHKGGTYINPGTGNHYQQGN